MRRVVHVSSNSPFGTNPHPGDTFRNDEPYHPYYGYGRSKMQAELRVLDAVDRGLDAVIVRPPWFYGPFQPARQTTFFRMVRTGRFPVIGDGQQRRSMAYVDNLVQGVVAAELVPTPAGRGWWIADARPYTIEEIVATVGRALAAEGIAVKPNRLRLPALAGRVAERADGLIQRTGRYVQTLHVLGEMDKTIACDISVAREELGYDPQIALEEGMRRSVRWCLEQGLDAVSEPRHGRQRLLRVACWSSACGARATPSGCSTSTTRAERPPASRWCRATSATRAGCGAAVDGIDVVFHNVAQVPLARDPTCSASVNVDGTANLLAASAEAGVSQGGAHVVERGVRRTGANPVMPTTVPAPMEAYGRPSWPPSGPACGRPRDGLDVSIVRPRTILGHGRLGIFGILFDWIADGADPIVLGDGTNRYQFVHADDLADVCLLAGARSGPSIFNAGTDRFGTMREALAAPVRSTPGTGAQVRPLPAGPAARGDAGQRRAAPDAVRAVPLADVRPVDVVRHRARAGAARAGRRAGRPTRCSPRATTGSWPTGRRRPPTPAAPRPTAAPPAPACSASLKHLTGFLPPVR